MERKTWPETAALIAGKFLRHGDAFYEWRVEDRRARLVDEPDALPLMDDLGVALDKLGRHHEAIAVATTALEIDPNRYETHANLGTFHVHAGELEVGLRHIERSLAINPDAHFGRERYQKLLVEHLLCRAADGAECSDFAYFVTRQPDVGDEFAELERAQAGVEGMMRFGDHTSPVLLEALGSLLTRQTYEGRGYRPGRLAALAYARAMMGTHDETAKDALELAGWVALESEVGSDFVTLQYTLRWDVADAEAWFAQIRDDELRWIADPDVDPDSAYEAKYYREPWVDDEAEEPERPRAPGSDWAWLLWIPAGGAVLTLVLGRAHAMS